MSPGSCSKVFCLPFCFIVCLPILITGRIASFLQNYITVVIFTIRSKVIVISIVVLALLSIVFFLLAPRLPLPPSHRPLYRCLLLQQFFRVGLSQAKQKLLSASHPLSFFDLFAAGVFQHFFRVGLWQTKQKLPSASHPLSFFDLFAAGVFSTIFSSWALANQAKITFSFSPSFIFRFVRSWRFFNNFFELGFGKPSKNYLQLLTLFHFSICSQLAFFQQFFRVGLWQTKQKLPSASHPLSFFDLFAAGVFSTIFSSWALANQAKITFSFSPSFIFRFVRSWCFSRKRSKTGAVFFFSVPSLNMSSQS